MAKRFPKKYWIVVAIIIVFVVAVCVILVRLKRPMIENGNQATVPPEQEKRVFELLDHASAGQKVSPEHEKKVFELFKNRTVTE